MMMDAHALDITMSEAEETEERLGWDNPYAVLERNFDSLTTTRYQLTSNGSFDMMAGYPIKTLVEEHWAGLGYFDGLPSSNLRILRNAIYAHYGMRFKSNDLKEYFSKKDYYKPQYDNVEKMLTPLDKSLITYLKALEDQ